MARLKSVSFLRKPILPTLLVVLAIGCNSAPDADREAPSDESPQAHSAESTQAPPGLEVAEGSMLAQAEDEGVAHFTYFFVPSGGFAYEGPDGELTGVTVEILRDFADHVEATRDIEVSVDWLEEEQWSTFYQQVRHSRGGVFGVGNVTITEARRDELQFSPPYLSNIAVLVTHENVPELPSMEAIGEAFEGMTALPYPGTLHEERLLAIGDEHLPDMPTRDVSSNDELVGLLASDEGYFGYIDIYNYWRARSEGIPLRRHPVGDDASEEFGIIFPLESDWGPVMDEFFRAGGGYTASERYHGLLREHLGDELATLLTNGG